MDLNGTVTAARNEYESFQVVVNGGDAGATVEGIQVTLPAGVDALVHRVHYIDIKNVSNCDGDLGLWPDAFPPSG